MANHVSPRGGFTLIELMLALALAGLVFIGILLLLNQLSDARSRFAQEAFRSDSRANGARVLRTLIERAVPRNDLVDHFVGDESEVEFASWCDVAAGWTEPCRVRLSVTQSPDSGVIRADLSTGEKLQLAGWSGSVEFRYFAAVAGADQWIRAWTSNVTVPAAFGVVNGSDTVVVRAGGRG
jgi:prepilin-type N-terminal cleavage/methylation domain-containing protein